MQGREASLQHSNIYLHELGFSIALLCMCADRGYMVETLNKWKSQKQCMAGRQIERVIALHCSRPEVDLWVTDKSGTAL